MKIIDAHMHPFVNKDQSLKWYCKDDTSDFENVKNDMERATVTHFCGSVIVRNKPVSESLKEANDTAFYLYEQNRDIYTPGVVVHPDFPDVSCEYIKKAKDYGLNLIGELTPYMYGWKEYRQAYDIIEYAGSLGMTISCHPTTDDDMENMLETFPGIKFVIAHPGDMPQVSKHIERTIKYDNAYIDISGSGFHRYHTVKELVSKVGKERVLFGTDYPICNPAAYVSAVLYENLTQDQLEHVFYKNAEYLYSIK